jgi:outer membrane lipoprotein-sorting protein
MFGKEEPGESGLVICGGARAAHDMRHKAKRTGAVAGMCLASLAAGAVAVSAQDSKPPANPVGVGNWNAKVSPDQATVATSLDERQTELVKKVTGYFNELNSLKGSFVQTGADRKRMRGRFYVKRPGRFRFDYALPSRQIIISDGNYLAIQDLDLNNEDRVALDQTPFRLLLRKDVDLLRDGRIIEAHEADDLIVLSLQDKDPDAPGRIKLFLVSKPTLELKEWVTTDAQGLETRVEISELSRTEDVDLGLFKIQPIGLLKSQQ